MQVTTVYMYESHLNLRIIWHVLENIRVFYIFKRPLSTPLNIFKHASIKCLRTIDLKMTFLTLTLPLLHFCLFVRPVEELFTHMDIWPILGTHALKGFFNVLSPTVKRGPCQSHLKPSVWQWRGHFMFFRLRSVATTDRSPIVLTSWMVKFKNNF